MKVVINTKIGGYTLSLEAEKRLIELDPTLAHPYFPDNVGRSNPTLIRVVEELGEFASDPRYARLKIVDVPDDVQWYIDTHEDGREVVAEPHRTWC